MKSHFRRDRCITDGDPAEHGSDSELLLIDAPETARMHLVRLSHRASQLGSYPSKPLCRTLIKPLLGSIIYLACFYQVLTISLKFIAYGT